MGGPQLFPLILTVGVMTWALSQGPTAVDSHGILTRQWFDRTLTSWWALFFQQTLMALAITVDWLKLTSWQGLVVMKDSCQAEMHPLRNFPYRMGDVRLFTQVHCGPKKIEIPNCRGILGKCMECPWKLTLFTFSLVLPFCRNMQRGVMGLKQWFLTWSTVWSMHFGRIYLSFKHLNLNRKFNSVWTVIGEIPILPFCKAYICCYASK